MRRGSSEQMYVFALVIVVMRRKQTERAGGGGEVGGVSEVHAAETIWQLTVPSVSLQFLPPFHLLTDVTKLSAPPFSKH